MKRNWTVYKHTFPDGKVYIGITGANPEKRWCNGHGYLGKTDGKYNQPLIARAIVQYGWANILHEIVADGLSEKEACRMEKYLIAEYHSNDQNFGYNLADGGIGGGITEAMKQHIKDVSIKTICNQTGVVYPSMRQASKDTGVCASSVRDSCKSGREYKGLSFSQIFD
jgi:hypothetical protein